MARSKIRFIIAFAFAAILAISLSLTAVSVSASVLEKSDPVSVSVADDNNFEIATAPNAPTTGTYFYASPAEPVNRRVCDANKVIVLKLDFTDKDSTNAGIGTIMTVSADAFIEVNTESADAETGWQTVVTGGTSLQGSAIVLTEASGLSDASILYYYISLGGYFGDGNVLYVRFGDKNPADGNGTVVLDRIDIYETMIVHESIVSLNVNSLIVDVADASKIYADNQSNITSNSLGTGRFADVDHYFIYKVRMPAEQCEDIYMKAQILGVNRAISFSPDNVDYTQVAAAPDISGIWGSDRAVGDTYYYSLDEYIGEEIVGGTKYAVVYVKFHATDEAVGNGACVYTLEFLNGSVRPQTGEAFLLSDKNLAYEIDVLDDSLVASSSQSSAATYFGQWGRKAAGSSAYFDYKFTLPEDAIEASVSVNSINSLLFQASSDGKTWQNVTPLSMSSNGDGSAVCYDLTFLLKEDKTVYVRFKGTNGQESMLLGMYLLYNRTGSALNGYEYDTESYQSFTTGDESETKYWQNPGSMNIKFTGNYREFDNSANGIYKFNYAAEAEAVHLFGQIGGTYLLSVSVDGENWYDLKTSCLQYYDSVVYPWYEVMEDFRIDISKWVMTDSNTERSVYVRVSDAVTDNASGATLRGLGIANCSGSAHVPAKEGGCNSTIGTATWVTGSALCALTAVVLCAIKRKKVGR